MSVPIMIDFNTATQDVQKQIVAAIDELIKKQDQPYPSFVGGAYVRDVLVPLDKDINNKITLSTVDFYFFHHQHIDKFVESCGSKLVKVNDGYVLIGNYGVGLAKVTFQVVEAYDTDFDIDNLVYREHKFTCFCSKKNHTDSFCTSSINELKVKVFNKTITMNEELCKLISSAGKPHSEELRRLDYFLNQGYTVEFGVKVPEKAVLKGGFGSLQDLYDKFISEYNNVNKKDNSELIKMLENMIVFLKQ